jgi:phosphoglycerol transferase
VIAFLVGTIGGFSTLIGAALPLLRAWARISVFIAFFSLLAVALLLDALRRRLAEHGRPAALGIGALAAVFLVGAVDQTSSSFTPQHSALESEWDGQRAFVRSIEARLPDRASVYQLPYVPFPEWPAVAQMQEYDLARGYLHSTDLRWSFGAIKARETERWLRDLSAKPLLETLPILSAVGFEGVYLDRFGYADNGAAAEAELRGLLGVQALASSDGRLLFFDLRGYSDRLRRERPAAELEALRAGAPGQA